MTGTANRVDWLNPAYHLLDLVPKGRDEAGLPNPMAWVKLHDHTEANREETNHGHR